MARSRADQRSGDGVKGRSQKIIRRKFNFRSASFSCKNKNIRAREGITGVAPLSSIASVRGPATGSSRAQLRAPLGHPKEVDLRGELSPT